MPEKCASDECRILHVTEAAAGGVLQHLDYIVPGLQRHRMKCACLIFSARADEDALAERMERWRAAGVETSNLHLPPRWLGKPGCWLKIFCALRRMIRSFKPDAVHFHSSQAGAVGRFLLYFVPGAFKVVYSPHAFYWHPDMKSSVKMAVAAAEWLLAWRTDRFVLVGPGEADQGRRMRLPWKRKVSMIANSLPENWSGMLLPRNEARRRLGIPENEFAAVVPGRFAWQKGQVRLLEMLAVTDLPEALRIYFCGADVGRIRQLHPALTRNSHYVFLEHVPDLGSCLAAFDLGMLPSRYEGLSYALLEMLAAGLPVLASDIPENQFVQQKAAGCNINLEIWRSGEEFRRLLAACLEKNPEPVSGDQIPQLFPLAEQIEQLGKLYAVLKGNRQGRKYE